MTAIRENNMDENLFSVIKDPVDKLVKGAADSALSSAQHAITGNISRALSKVGLGSDVANRIVNQLGNEILTSLSSEIFGKLGNEMNLSSKDKIEALRGVFFDGESIREDTVSSINSRIESYTFPADLNNFYIKMDFKKYRRPAPNVQANVVTEFSIQLPLPRSLFDRHAVSYNSEDQLGMVGAIFSQGQNGQIASGGFDYITAAAYTVQGISRALDAGGNVLSLLSQSFGAQLNPHLSVTFQSPRLREHKMQWVFAPNNEEESETLRMIIQKIKGASLPTRATDKNGNSNLNLLQYPMMCKMTLMPWGDDSNSNLVLKDRKVYDKHMYTFKHCVIDSVSVNYAPDSINFFDDESGANAPAFLMLDLSFFEIEYYTAEDFGRKGDRVDIESLLNTANKLKEDVVGVETQVKDNPYVSKVDPKGPDGNDSAGQFNISQAVVEQYSYVNDSGDKEYLNKTENGKWYLHTKESTELINTNTYSGYNKFGLTEAQFKSTAITSSQIKEESASGTITTNNYLFITSNPETKLPELTTGPKA